MPDDYKRAVCNFCPSQPVCNEFRGKLWCGTCEIALVCTMTEDVGVTDCNVAQMLWKDALPGKCLLTEKALAVFAQTSASREGAREGSDGFVRDKHSKIYCPRCMHTTLETRVDHDWNPFAGRKSQFQATCSICSLDEKIDLE